MQDIENRLVSAETVFRKLRQPTLFSPSTSFLSSLWLWGQSLEPFTKELFKCQWDSVCVWLRKGKLGGIQNGSRKPQSFIGLLTKISPHPQFEIIKSEEQPLA